MERLSMTVRALGLACKRKLSSASLAVSAGCLPCGLGLYARVPAPDVRLRLGAIPLHFSRNAYPQEMLMQVIIAVVVGLLVSAPVVAEPLVEGHVRLASGEGVAAQVMVFDLTAVARGPVARATTDADGHFALPLAALGGTFARPQGFALGQNYPNPFNPATIIPYQLPTATHVRLEVFNVLGQHLATLVNEVQPAGFHTVRWDATNAAGQAVGAGVYFYRLRGEGGGVDAADGAD